MILSVCMLGQTYRDRKQSDGWWSLGKNEMEVIIGISVWGDKMV